MPSTFTRFRYHIVFSTKNRALFIVRRVRNAIHRYIAAIARNKGGLVLEVDGAEDHVDLLLALPSSISVAEMLRVIKSSSSKWIRKRGLVAGFSWQEGYSGFTVSASAVPAVTSYIRSQRRHHTRASDDQILKDIQALHGVAKGPKISKG
jgi:putative transposase